MSGDQEYLRTTLLIRKPTKGNAVHTELLESGIRAMERHGRSGVTGSIVASERELPMWDRFGQFVGIAAAFVPEFDRIERACAGIVRGLYFHEFGERLDSAFGVTSVDVAAVMLRDVDVRDMIAKITPGLQSGTDRLVNEAFRYKFWRDQESPRSAWGLIFYEQFLMVSAVLLRETAPPTLRVY